MNKPQLYSIAALIAANTAKLSSVKGLPLGIIAERHLHRRYQDKPKAPDGGWNAKCQCGSGKKWKKCCGNPETPEKETTDVQPRTEAQPRPVAEPDLSVLVVRGDDGGGTDGPLPHGGGRDGDAQPA